MFTFLVNHVIGHIPVWIWPFVAGVGFTAYFCTGVLSYFPQMNPWARFVKPLCFVVFTIGVFMSGTSGVVEIMQQQVKEAEAKAKVAEEQSAKANTELLRMIETQQQLIDNQSSALSKKIIKDKKSINNDCKLINKDAIDDYNRALTTPGVTTK